MQCNIPILNNALRRLLHLAGGFTLVASHRLTWLCHILAKGLATIFGLFVGCVAELGYTMSDRFSRDVDSFYKVISNPSERKGGS